MIALDTNVLVRFLTNDDREQAKRARELLGTLSIENPGFVCREVAVEIAWVLAGAYGLARQDIAQVFKDLVASAELDFEAAEDVVRAADRFGKGGAGFSDQMIAAAAQRRGAEVVYAIDKQAADMEGFTLLG